MKKIIFITILIVFNIISFGIYPQPNDELSYNIILLGDSWQEVLISHYQNIPKENIVLKYPLILSSIYLGEDKNNLKPVDLDSPEYYCIIQENLDVGKKYFWKYVYKDPQTKEIIFESKINTFTVSEDYIFLKKVFSKILNAGFLELKVNSFYDLPLQKKKELIILFEEVLNEIGNYYLQKYNDIYYVYDKINEFTDLIKSCYYSSKYFFDYSSFFYRHRDFTEKETLDQPEDITLTKNDNKIDFIAFFGIWLKDDAGSYTSFEGIDLRYFISISKNKVIVKKIYDENLIDIDDDFNYYPYVLNAIKINITNDALNDYVFYATSDFRERYPKIYAIFSYDNDYKVFFLGYSRTRIIEEKEGDVGDKIEIIVKNINSKQFELYIPDGIFTDYMPMVAVGPVYYKIFTYDEKENKMKYIGYSFPDSEENMTYFFLTLLGATEEVEEELKDNFNNILHKIISDNFRVFIDSKVEIDKKLLKDLVAFFPNEKYELTWERNGFKEFDLYVSFDNGSFFKVNSERIRDTKYILYVPFFVKNVKWKIRAYLDNTKFIESETQNFLVTDK